MPNRIDDKYCYEKNVNKYNYYVRKMLNIMCNIFIYHNLPDTITNREIELKLMSRGFIAFGNPKKSGYDGIYALTGTLGGPPDIHGEPTIFLSDYYKIAGSQIGEWEIMYNTSSALSIIDIINYYYKYLENILTSIDINAILSRASFIINAKNDSDRLNVEKWIKNLIEGKIATLVTSKSLIDDIEINPGYTAHNNITPLIEAFQYIKSQMFSDLGLPMSHNMKRESLNDSEVTVGIESINAVLIDMLKCRKNAIDRINKRFNLNISVEMSKEWSVQFNENLGLDESRESVSRNERIESIE